MEFDSEQLSENILPSDDLINWLLLNMENGDDMSEYAMKSEHKTAPRDDCITLSTCDLQSLSSSIFTSSSSSSFSSSTCTTSSVISSPLATASTEDFSSGFPLGACIPDLTVPRSLDPLTTSIATSINSIESKEPFDELNDKEFVGTSDSNPQPLNPKNGAKTLESSKETRKRKREKINELEDRLSLLKAENAELNAHLMTVTQRTTEVQKQRSDMERLMAGKMQKLIDESSSQGDLAATVKQYTDIYADYGECRRKEVAFHVQQLQRLLLPTKTTKMSLWTLQQDNSFFQGSKSSLFDILSKELRITPDQAKKIQQHRGRIKELLKQLKESLALIDQLKSAIEEKHTAFDSECGKIQAEVSPQQTVRFLLWISKNADKLGNVISDFSNNAHIPAAAFVQLQSQSSSELDKDGKIENGVL